MKHGVASMAVLALVTAGCSTGSADLDDDSAPTFPPGDRGSLAGACADEPGGMLDIAGEQDWGRPGD